MPDKQPNISVEYLPVSKLKPYKNNARKHEKFDIDAIAESIKTFGFCDPIGLWGDDVIVEGHGRVLAAKQLGMETVPCIRLDHLSDEERRAYALAHNQTSANSSWDEIFLPMELEAITEIDMTAFGFDVSSGKAGTEIVEDEFDPEPPEEPKSKRGQLYLLGDHRLMCGDSSDPSDFLTLMGGCKADMVFTDPPYGVAIGDKNAALNEIQRGGRVCENIEGDTLSEEDLYELLKKAFINVRENCAEDACYYVTSPQGGSLGLMMMMMRDAGLPVRHVLMWEKNSATFSIGRLDYDYQHEPIFYTWTKAHHNFRGGEYRTTVWKYDKPRKCDLHPTMKPIELVANAILDGTQKGMIVLDAFGGSGTTIIAAEQTGRSARVMEIDPRYVDVIIDRWEKFTGGKAVLLNG